MLGPDLVKLEWIAGELFFKPSNKKKSLVKLCYYSNHVSVLFAMEGVIGMRKIFNDFITGIRYILYLN